MDPLIQAICSEVSEKLSRPIHPVSTDPVGGGCINEALCLRDAGGHRYFVKSSSGSAASAMFEAEMLALEELASSETLKVPRPIARGESGGRSWLVTEWIDLSGPRAGSQAELGRRLARLHKVQPPRFGWHRDNTIGSTPQINPESDDWPAFFRDHRLGYQFRLAQKQGITFEGSEPLLEHLEGLFEGYEPRPSLLHGDLWSGNVGYTAAGEPVVYDPATYHGDREAEFGIIVMFGGFGSDFHEGYQSEWPLDRGFRDRLPLYELYHTLNHLNLFGMGYAAGCRHLIRQLLITLGAS